MQLTAEVTAVSDPIDVSTSAEPAPSDPLADAIARERRILARLREALVALEPGVPPELIRGETLEEIEASFEAARALAERARAAAAQALRLPAGAPPRTAPAAASPFEKIRAGLTPRTD
ncbi:MAG: hypothetical protein RMK15_07535 [Chloroflexota bacterium]|jgi:hypothetical protein|nr:hypothetical protein [Dehalococcoidia bacterium]MDW8047113.1 hypothetical protein [Chloroflexota bacterium]